jgi:hypothetical protein
MCLYEADVVLYAGDLTGKAMVPVVEVDDGVFEAELAGQLRRARSQGHLERLEKDAARMLPDDGRLMHSQRGSVGQIDRADEVQRVPARERIARCARSAPEALCVGPVDDLDANLQAREAVPSTRTAIHRSDETCA